MKFILALASLMAIVIVTLAAHAVAPDPVLAQTTAEALEMQAEVDLLNELYKIGYATWSSSGGYDLLRKNPRYRKIAWAQDGCSAPIGIAADVLNAIMLHGCLRHDMGWRTLSVIDRTKGRVWNERNRYRADLQFKSDGTTSCGILYPADKAVDVEQLLYTACTNSVNGAYDLIRRFAGYRKDLTGEEEGSVENSTHSLYDSGMKFMPANSGCSDENNRCLPIHYVTAMVSPSHRRTMT